MKKKASLLGRRQKESEIAHRSFLLWAMQLPEKRNVRLTARAIDRSEATLRSFKKRWEWVDRAKNMTADTAAQALYRKMYVSKFGTTSLEVIEHNIATPISKVGTVPKSVAEIVQKTIKTQKSEAKKKNPEDVMRQKHVGLIDAAIGYIAAGLRDGDVKVNLRDIPLLIQTRNSLLHLDDRNKSPELILESVRVRQAKDTGGDIVEAMIEDAEELTMILKSLRIAKRNEEYAEHDRSLDRV
ncbi:MAG: hypothetical protein ACR2M6_02695 [Vampirovibrionia bacterium]